jgi:WD40 repeat protein
MLRFPGLLLCLAVLVMPGPAARAGLLFVNSGNTGQILAYDAGTGASQGVFVASGGANDLTFGPNGNLFVGNGGVQEYNGTTGAFIANFVPYGSAGLTTPYGLVFGPNGNLFVSSRFSGPGQLGQILEFNGTTGAPVGSGIFVQGSTAALHDPLGLTFGPNGSLFVVDGYTGNVLQFDGTTAAFDGVFTAGNSDLIGPVGLTFGPNGNLFVTGGVRRAPGPNGEVLEYDGTTGAFITAFVAAGSGGLNGPQSLAFGPDGNLFVTSYDANNGGNVLVYDGATGAFDRVFIPAGSGGLNGPNGLVFGPNAAVPEPSCLALGAMGAFLLLGYALGRKGKAGAKAAFKKTGAELGSVSSRGLS